MHNRLLMYDSLQSSFLSVKKPLKQPTCPVCSSDEAAIRSMEDSWTDLNATRGPLSLVEGDRRLSVQVPASPSPRMSISCQEYNELASSGLPHVLLDVRVREQFEMCRLDGAVNIPLRELEAKLERVEELSAGQKPVYCICRRGIFSADATRVLARVSEERPLIYSVKNITGGLLAWTEEVDPSFPKY